MKKKHLGLIAFIGTSILTLTACGAKIKTESSSVASQASSNETVSEATSSKSATSSSAATSSSSAASSSTSSKATASSSASSSNTATASSSASTSSSNVDTITDSSSFQISLATAGVGAFTQSGSIYTITAAGEYDLSGVLEDGVLYVEAGDDAEVVLNLNGVSMSSTTNSPICILSASDVDISAKKGTVNTIVDNRTSIDSTDETQGTAAIYSACDLKIKGTGTLNVYGDVNNGIHSKDDLKIQKATLYVHALNNALKGNDSVEIISGNLTVISTGGDGIKTTNADVNTTTSKQKGIITITGTASVDVYACCDGIDAAYDAIICADDAGDEPTVNIKTSTYSSYSDDAPCELSSTVYMKIKSTYYNSNYDYYLYCYNTNTGSYEWIKLEYYTTTSSSSGFMGGSGSTYYYLTASVDNLTTSYTSLGFYVFTSGATPSTTSYYAASVVETINSSKDMYSVSSISSGTINGSWSNYSSTSSTSTPGGMSMQDEGNTDKTEYSTKGIKASNEITISGGVIDIESYDDAIHANYGSTLDSETGTYGTGNVTISGGTMNITTKDDGIHAEQTLSILGGTIVVETSYEGLEGPQIQIGGGDIHVYGSDDGLNAGTSSYFSSAITISGGSLAVTVGTGDTDAIDSNGTYTQTGGNVVSINNAGSSGTASVLDCDSTVKITGGTFAGFGKVESTPTVSNVTKTTVSASFTSGSYTLNYTDGSTTVSLVTFDLSTSYSSIYFAGPSGSYTFLKGTSTLKTFSL